MKSNHSLLVSELFYSIQGESSYAGYPCLFIRLAGCNLRCSYCDARYTYEEAGREMALAEVIAFVQASPVPLVEITGGEPLLQKNVYRLMDELLAADRRVLLETNGSISLEKVPAGVVKIMDVKCPGSGMHAQLRADNFARLGPGDELKFVLCSRADYDWAVAMLGKNSFNQDLIIHFSPVTGQLAPSQLAEWILHDRLPVRLQLQLHKVLWPAVNRGK